MENPKERSESILLIDEDLCTGCLSCKPYCPVSAIFFSCEEGVAGIDKDRCVECRVCIRSQVCPVEAFAREELEWPRIIRAAFSDPRFVHSGTDIAGRGTAEMKTNDVTDNYKTGSGNGDVRCGKDDSEVGRDRR